MYLWERLAYKLSTTLPLHTCTLQKVHQLLQQASSSLHDSTMLQLVLSSNTSCSGPCSSHIIKQASTALDSGLAHAPWWPAHSLTINKSGLGNNHASPRVVKSLLLTMHPQDSRASYKTWEGHLQGRSSPDQVSLLLTSALHTMAMLASFQHRVSLDNEEIIPQDSIFHAQPQS